MHIITQPMQLHCVYYYRHTPQTKAYIHLRLAGKHLTCNNKNSHHNIILCKITYLRKHNNFLTSRLQEHHDILSMYWQEKLVRATRTKYETIMQTNRHANLLSNFSVQINLSNQLTAKFTVRIKQWYQVENILQISVAFIQKTSTKNEHTKYKVKTPITCI